jgi:hypothetical protein
MKGTAYDYVRCVGHPCCDWNFEGGHQDNDPGHGKNFQACGAALHLRTVRDLGFGVRWVNRPRNLNRYR